MKVYTFNVNGINARLPQLLAWLANARPDVVCLQEIKSQDATCPRLEIEALGYHMETHGQKGFNGVALLSREPLTDIVRGLPGDDTDEQSRWIEGTTMGLKIVSLYLPNGNPQPGPKFDYKLAWMDRMIVRARNLLLEEQPLILAGDYNVCPTNNDVHNPSAMAEDALMQPESRSRWRQLFNLGYLDAIRAIEPTAHCYSYWDYQAGAWSKDHGLRIDHLALSPQAADRLKDAGVDRKPRALEKPSDHTPVWCELT